MWYYFSRAEFDCNCGCGGGVEDRLIDTLDAVRKQYGCPLYITSGYRCAVHNAAVGGAPASYHTRGLAADIVPADGQLLRLAAALEAAAPMSGIIIYWSQGFVHFDLRGYIYRHSVD